MRAIAVIGANYGDEGKGLMVDYLCRQTAASIVVRCNGGAQAGHTVEQHGVGRHVFSHIGSGTLTGARTLLTSTFVCNPALFNPEFDKVLSLGREPDVTVSAQCPVTTPWEMLLNQAVERRRAANRHGSCGVGFGETLERHVRTGGRLNVASIRNPDLYLRLKEIRDGWFKQRAVELGVEEDPLLTIAGANPDIMDRFIDDCERFRQRTTLPDIGEHWELARFVTRDGTDGPTVIFEGAQGLMLDQDHPNFPHVTRSKTGVHHAAAWCRQLGVRHMQAIYVTRTYLTRHGAGPLPNEQPMPFYDRTNRPHDYQGTLRYAPLDWAALKERVALDSLNINSSSQLSIEPSLAVTWADVPHESGILEDPMVRYVSRGPRASDVAEVQRIGKAA